jgi:hypothetical protein
MNFDEVESKRIVKNAWQTSDGESPNNELTFGQAASLSFKGDE